MVYHVQVDRSDINYTKIIDRITNIKLLWYFRKHFKELYNNHTTYFRNKSKEKSTKVSKHIWELKNYRINYDLKWSLTCKAHSYIDCTSECDLCLTEKLTLMKADPKSLLNNRDELVSKYRHINSSLRRNN